MAKILRYVGIGLIVIGVVVNVVYAIELHKTVSFYKNQLHQLSIQQEEAKAKTEDENSQFITKEQAITIALNHANVSEADVSFLRAKEEIDNGISLYDIEFRIGLSEYNYDIDTTGKILEFDIDN